MKIYSIMLKIVAHYLYRITSFLIIYFVMHHADIPFHLGYNSYKLLRTDSTLFFNTRFFWERAIVTYFRSLRRLAFFAKYVDQSARCIEVSFKTDRKCLQNAAYERFQSIEHVCGRAFYRNFQKEKLSESAVVIYRFWNEARNHLFTVSATVPSIAQL